MSRWTKFCQDRIRNGTVIHVVIDSLAEARTRRLNRSYTQPGIAVLSGSRKGFLPEIRSHNAEPIDASVFPRRFSSGRCLCEWLGQGVSFYRSAVGVGVLRLRPFHNDDDQGNFLRKSGALLLVNSREIPSALRVRSFTVRAGRAMLRTGLGRKYRRLL